MTDSKLIKLFCEAGLALAMVPVQPPLRQSLPYPNGFLPYNPVKEFQYCRNEGGLRPLLQFHAGLVVVHPALHMNEMLPAVPVSVLSMVWAFYVLSRYGYDRIGKVPCSNRPTALDYAARAYPDLAVQRGIGHQAGAGRHLVRGCIPAPLANQ